jgi:hypothetical protein
VLGLWVRCEEEIIVYCLLVTEQKHYSSWNINTVLWYSLMYQIIEVCVVRGVKWLVIRSIMCTINAVHSKIINSR